MIPGDMTVKQLRYKSSDDFDRLIEFGCSKQQKYVMMLEIDTIVLKIK